MLLPPMHPSVLSGCCCCCCCHIAPSLPCHPSIPGHIPTNVPHTNALGAAAGRLACLAIKPLCLHPPLRPSSAPMPAHDTWPHLECSWQHADAVASECICEPRLAAAVEQLHACLRTLSLILAVNVHDQLMTTPPPPAAVAAAAAAAGAAAAVAASARVSVSPLCNCGMLPP
jgi:hypothetical protein